MLVGPLADRLGEHLGGTEYATQIEVREPECQEGGGQLRAKRLPGPQRSKIEPTLPWPQTEPNNRVSLVPVGRNRASRSRLLSADHVFQAGESGNQWAKLRERFHERASTLGCGVKDAELALRIVKSPVTHHVPRRESSWIRQPADAIKQPTGRTRLLDRAHPLAKKFRAAPNTACGLSASRSAGAWSSRSGFIPMNQARNVSDDSDWSNNWLMW